MIDNKCKNNYILYKNANNQHFIEITWQDPTDEKISHIFTLKDLEEGELNDFVNMLDNLGFFYIGEINI